MCIIHPWRPSHLCLTTFMLSVGCTRTPDSPGTAQRPGYAGSASCAQCHPMQAAAFAKSDHAKAMDLPTATSVKGDFNNATFDHLGVRSTFTQKGGTYFVQTENAKGELETFEVAYVFGVYPLQQYLVRFPGGRLQCLPVCYDTRPKDAGGQRWFHIYGDEKIAHDDPLHWTGPMQNWNHMCASCHSTALEKGYDIKTDTFHTTWGEMSVSCESCHGPGAAHEAWAKKPPTDRPSEPLKGFAHALVDHQRQWVMNPDTGIAKRVAPPPPAGLVDSCMRCHARAVVLDEKAPATAPLADARYPELLMPDTYHGTGELKDEVYEWGSFTQSRMHAAGVTCVDCHDPHTGQRKLPGNFLCAQCHLPAKFDTPAHHHHAADSAGALCVNCHMPQHTYMGVDARRDHGFRVPRPDLTEKFGAAEAPNACAACHTKPTETPTWAAAAIKSWNGGRDPRPTFAEALLAGRAGTPDAGRRLADVAAAPTMPAVARATALALLGGQTQSAAEAQRLAAAAEKGVKDADPFVRAATLRLPLDPDQIHRLATPLLFDDTKLVRIAAARALAAQEKQLSGGDKAAYDRALAELIASEELNADRAESQTNLGVIALLRGDTAEAERHFQLALARNPSFAPAWVNRAELCRLGGDDAAGRRILEEGLQKTYDKAPLQHALGLLLIRQKDYAAAKAQFAAAAKARPEIPQHALLLALTADALGQRAEAITTLRQARLRHPFDRDLLGALAEQADKAGFADEAAAARALLAKWE